MDLKLEGKKVVVTGGSRGMGLDTARRFAQEGAHVSICARNLETLEAARSESVQALVLPCMQHFATWPTPKRSQPTSNRRFKLWAE